MTLTQQERDKFSAYLKMEAQTEAGLADQMDKLGPGMAHMAKFTVDVEVLRSYVVEVQANDAEEARKLVDGMDLATIEADGNYVDTFTDIGTVYNEDGEEIE